MATLHLMVGLPCAGKTTRAREIEATGALRLTKDEWMKAIFGDENPERGSDVIEGRLVDIGLRALELGTDVVIDFGLWGRDERTALRHAATERGAHVDMVWLQVDPVEQRRRRDERFAAAPHTTWDMTDDDLDRYAATIQRPTPGEVEGTEPLDPVPDGFTTWEAWRRWRWPATMA